MAGAAICDGKTLQIVPSGGSENDDILFRDANPKRSPTPPPTGINSRFTADRQSWFYGADFGTQDFSFSAVQSLFPNRSRGARCCRHSVAEFISCFVVGVTSGSSSPQATLLWLAFPLQ